MYHILHCEIYMITSYHKNVLSSPDQRNDYIFSGKLTIQENLNSSTLPN